MATVILKKKREKSLRHRHPWVYSGAVERVDGDVTPGAIVDVVDADGVFHGRGYFNAKSKIVVRVLSWEQEETIDGAWWSSRVARAVEHRRSVLGDDTTACRIVHAEADLLPGLIVDCYGDVVVAQFLTAGVEAARDDILAALEERLSPAAIYDRSDTTARAREGLDASTGWVRGEHDGEVAFRENGLAFQANVTAGQKTGFYLDQRENRTRVARYAAGCDVLDAFAYTGAFSAYAMRAGAKSVTLVDSSGTSLEVAKRNLAANEVDESAVTMVQEDVNGALRLYRAEERRFGMIIVDPPKFATNKHQVAKALRAYKDANMVAMSLLEPDGILATFSCSGAVDANDFTLAVSWAGIDAGRNIQILERLSQPADHPVLATFPESEYLKGLICRVG